MSASRRLDELLMLRAVEGLAPEEARELDTLIATEPDADPEAYDAASAALDLAMGGEEEALPAHLRARLVADARRAIGPRASQTSETTKTDPGVADNVVSFEPRVSRRESSGAWLPWLAAAAAAFIAVVGWWPRVVDVPTTEIPVADSAPIESPDDESSREPFSLATLESAPDALVRGWTATDDPAALGAASGEVVWSAGQQAGFMRIAGLAANDPSVEQYQLWIFDRDQDERYPVDGGVFDIPAGDIEAIVPIQAKIAVGEPYLFAVTVEKPGGVVVSSRERIALLAEV